MVIFVLYDLYPALNILTWCAKLSNKWKIYLSRSVNRHYLFSIVQLFPCRWKVTTLSLLCYYFHGKCSANATILSSKVQKFASKKSHAKYTGSGRPHFLLIPLVTDSRENTFPMTMILTSSSLESTVNYATYFQYALLTYSRILWVALGIILDKYSIKYTFVW